MCLVGIYLGLSVNTLHFGYHNKWLYPKIDVLQKILQEYTMKMFSLL